MFFFTTAHISEINRSATHYYSPFIFIPNQRNHHTHHSDSRTHISAHPERFLIRTNGHRILHRSTNSRRNRTNRTRENESCRGSTRSGISRATKLCGPIKYRIPHHRNRRILQLHNRPEHRPSQHTLQYISPHPLRHCIRVQRIHIHPMCQDISPSE